MANDHGKTFTRNMLLAHVGDMGRIASVKPCRLVARLAFGVPARAPEISTFEAKCAAAIAAAKPL